jgi:hypothetical protein
MMKTYRISVDGEMLGGVVGHFSMVEIGACVLPTPGGSLQAMKTFGQIIAPSAHFAAAYEHGARKVLRRSFEEFLKLGRPPQDVAHEFIDFCDEARGENGKVELVGVNIAFDFGFIREFLYRFCPDRYDVIGHKGYDITSFACSELGFPLGDMSAKKAWFYISQINREVFDKYYPGALTHNASQDAIDQAKLLLALEELQARQSKR